LVTIINLVNLFLTKRKFNVPVQVYARVSPGSIKFPAFVVYIKDTH